LLPWFHSSFALPKRVEVWRLISAPQLRRGHKFGVTFSGNNPNTP
jgi:hypothetical protein